MIHPTAVVDPKAEIHPTVKIGPFCHVGPHVILEEGVELLSHVVLANRVHVGKHTRLFPFCVLGEAPQHLSFKGEPSWVKIGAHCLIR